MAEASKPALEAKGVTYTYPEPQWEGRAYFSKGKMLTEPAIKDVEFTVGEKEKWLIVGENGSGKSTVSSAVAGLRKVKGKLEVMGRDSFEDMSLVKEVGFVAEAWSDNVGWASTVEQTVFESQGKQEEITKERFLDLCSRLHVNPSWRVDHCSSGMKRRIQILFAMLKPKPFLVLDEITPDLDIAERMSLLTFLDNLNATVLFITHIFDQIEDWATHVGFMAGGKMVNAVPTSTKTSTQEQVYGFIAEQSQREVTPLEKRYKADKTYDGADRGRTIVEIDNFHFQYGKDTRWKKASIIFKGLSFKVGRGERVVVAGTNGCGKSTLFRLLAGKHLFPEESKCLIDGTNSFHNCNLHDTVGFSTNWWAESGRNMSVREQIEVNLKGKELDERALELKRVLDVNLDWMINTISFGQRVRVAMFFNLMTFKPLLLLDEVTAYLDVLQRIEFLQWAFKESEERGCTILYSTHIFEGLEGWATRILLLDALEGKVAQDVDTATHPEVGANADPKVPLPAFITREMMILKRREWAIIGDRIEESRQLGPDALIKGQPVENMQKNLNEFQPPRPKGYAA